MKDTDTVEFEGIQVHPYIRLIHTKIKTVFVKSLSTLLKLIPQRFRRDELRKIECLDLRRQWMAVENGLQRYNAENKTNLQIGGKGRSNEAITLILVLYMTILEHDGNWQRIMTLIIDEYRKIRGW